MNCPHCSTSALDAAGRCDRCQGALLAEAVVTEKVGRALELSSPGPSDLACPACGARMVDYYLYGIPIDRCEDHGLWFDVGELDTVLHRVKDSSWRLYSGPSGLEQEPALGGAPAYYRQSLVVMLWRKLFGRPGPKPPSR